MIGNYIQCTFRFTILCSFLRDLVTRLYIKYFYLILKENGFKLAKEKCRRYAAKTIPDADYADDITLPANSPAQAETLIPSLERAAGSIGPHINADKTEYICFNQRGNISTRKGGPLKLVDKLTYLESSVLSTENDINMRLIKAWTPIDRLSDTWKSDLTDKIKRSFFRSSGRIHTAIWRHHMHANKTFVEKAWRQLHKNFSRSIQ